MGLKMSKLCFCCGKMHHFYQDYKYVSELNALEDPKDIKFFNLEGTYKAKCIKCYDGDTVHLIFKYPYKSRGKLWKWKCRLNGIDTPEMKSSNPKEKYKATEAKEYLSSLILNKIVVVEVVGFDKYGRLLAYLRLKTRHGYIDISSHMIEKGYAKAYSGGKKEEWVF